MGYLQDIVVVDNKSGKETPVNVNKWVNTYAPGTILKSDKGDLQYDAVKTTPDGKTEAIPFDLRGSILDNKGFDVSIKEGYSPHSPIKTLET